MIGKALTIGQAAKSTGLTTQGIRFYEGRGLLTKVGRTHTGYRFFGPEALRRLEFIKQARRVGLSLDEIKEVLAMSRAGHAPCCRVRELLSAKLEELERAIADMSAFRNELRRFLAQIARTPGQADTSQKVCVLIESAPDRLKRQRRSRP
jgi:DNA-binding transcriptional MerR regulator